MVSIEAIFPGLQPGKYVITSAASPKYNCIAWAAGNDRTCWWPSEDDRDFWPSAVASEESIAAFQAMFASLGYAACATSDAEPAVEKIALFIDVNGVPTHAARQLPNGRWTSKLGELEDIEHDLTDLEGEAYGKVVVLMKRTTQAKDPQQG
jgi:hypothetical protein